MKAEWSIEELMGDTRLLARVKLDNFLLVERGLRPCSQLTVPAELPGAESMGATIDGRVRPLMVGLQGIGDPRKRLEEIERIKKDMRAAYRDVVEASDQFRAHLEWAKRLGLRSLRHEVRPTVHELYLFRDRKVKKSLDSLMKERGKIMARAIRNPPPEPSRSRIAYPEEFKGSWLREMGDLLGYPRCCVERYAGDREGGFSVEDRAALQIKEETKHGDINPFAYFVGYFFPCSPRCEAALTRGREVHERLSGLGPRLGELYRAEVAENMDRISRQPEIIAAFKAKAMEADRGLKRETI